MSAPAPAGCCRTVAARRSVFMGIVMAHRHGIVGIPALTDRASAVSDKLAWLAQRGLGTVSGGDWKNACRLERTSRMLPLGTLKPCLDRMLAMPVGVSSGEADRLRY
ncbi:hypothetical protein LVY72_13965 [Arthrobacter sp. I2-34]|uniref:Uncharacterized protein n=1 Tax=Arthrobacter hankyongi TaxID=2904801 RepID=A0ABS9L8K7_9MICC|nr:hypothetical protein [Arthrobacter hankyongi]MCG2623004.1 hypothetical protein [Arthrobacter hankyongi]